MLTAISIFIIVGGMLGSVVYMMSSSWRKGERQRRTYEQAQEILSQLALDLEAAFTRDSVTSGVPMVRFFCVRDAATGTQRLDFVRTFESGPERAITFYAGSSPGASQEYSDAFMGAPTDLKAMGGLIGVSYFLTGRELRRAVQGPPSGPSASGGGLPVQAVARTQTGVSVAALTRTTDGAGEVLSESCLHLGFQFWTQYTGTWSGPPPDPRRPKLAWGPETVWDSTRGAGIAEFGSVAGLARPFALEAGPASLADPSDDVFPQVVEVTLVLEPDERRSVRTDLTAPLSESATEMFVASTLGFEDPRYGSPYLLVGSEWVKVKEKRERSFVLDAKDARGRRNTAPAAHGVGAVVRAGVTFLARFPVPAFREDRSGSR